MTDINLEKISGRVTYIDRGYFDKSGYFDNSGYRIILENFDLKVFRDAVNSADEDCLYMLDRVGGCYYKSSRGNGVFLTKESDREYEVLVP